MFKIYYALLKTKTKKRNFVQQLKIKKNVIFIEFHFNTNGNTLNKQRKENIKKKMHSPGVKVTFPLKKREQHALHTKILQT